MKKFFIFIKDRNDGDCRLYTIEARDEREATDKLYQNFFPMLWNMSSLELREVQSVCSDWDFEIDMICEDSVVTL